jgi:glycosyltransferase involved in cell wall biosynthesis
MISTIISTKNNDLTIRYVLTSLLFLVDKFDIELIVVDGGSKDKTPRILSDFIVSHGNAFVSTKILRDPGVSLSYARHLGFKNSTGDILVFLDGDTPLSGSFKYYLERELGESDLISPVFECIPLDEATRVFNLFIKTVSYIQSKAVTRGRVFSDPSILPPARIYKRRVLEGIKGYPVSSRFFGEDRIATALAIRLGFRYKFSTRLKLFKIDKPGYGSYWKKHCRYVLGIHRDLTSLGKSILKGYIIARRLNHINILFPILSILYAGRSLAISRNIREAIEVLLMKYLIDLAMFIGDLKGFIHGEK